MRKADSQKTNTTKRPVSCKNMNHFWQIIWDKDVKIRRFCDCWHRAACQHEQHDGSGFCLEKKKWSRAEQHAAHAHTRARETCSGARLQQPRQEVKCRALVSRLPVASPDIKQTLNPLGAGDAEKKTTVETLVAWSHSTQQNSPNRHTVNYGVTVK